MRQEKKNQNVFSCNDCSKTFGSAFSLKLHSYRHMTNRPFKCQLCPKSYGRSAHLKRHVNVVHGKDLSNYTLRANMSNDKKSNGLDESDEDMEIELMYDSDGLLKEDSLVKSRQSDNESPMEKFSPEQTNFKLYNCKYCVESFRQPSLLKEHLNSHPNSRPYECSNCDKRFMSTSALYKHRKKKHGADQNSIFLMNKKMLNKYDKNNTLEYKTQKRPGNNFKDKVKIENQTLKCVKDFSEQIKYDSHLISHENESSRMVKCEFCEKKFKSTLEMLQHSKIHNKSRIRVCLQCNRTFTNYVQFHCHKNSHIRKLHQCLHCLKTYSKNIYLRKHMTTHSFSSAPNLKEFLLCKFCVLYFFTQKDFEEHLKNQHTIYQSHEKSFTCKLCNLLFDDIKLFAHHLEIQHPKPIPIYKKHKCEFCKKYYSKKKYLENHMQIHLNENNKNLLDIKQYIDGKDIVNEESNLNGGDNDISMVAQNCIGNQIDFYEQTYFDIHQNLFDNQMDIYGGIAFIPN